MSRPFAEPCSLTSRTGAAITLLPALVVFASALPLAGAVSLPALLAMLAAALHILHQLRRGFARQLVVGCDRYGRWWIADDRAPAVAIDVSGASVASRAGLFLVYRLGAARWHRARYLPAWTLDAEDYRRIRVRLRVTAGAPVAAPATWSGRS